MARKSGTLRIGTSGWMYKDWGALFYPPDLKKGHLTFLAQTFNTVEINSSFYHLPLKSTFQKWTKETPKDLTFAVKLSRFITHQKRLVETRASLELFLKRAEPMKAKLGVILMQLPPTLAFHEDIFSRFIEDLQAALQSTYAVRLALEVRHVSWIAPENIKQVLTHLHKAKIAMVFAQSGTMLNVPPEDTFITSDFIYLRFHGPREFAASRYGPRLLKPWAERTEKWLNQGLDVFAYFNNDSQGHAIYDAKTFLRQLKRAPL